MANRFRVLAVVLAGGLLALVVLMLRAFGWSEEIRRRIVLLRPRGGIPYGVAIAAGARSLRWRSSGNRPAGA